MTDKDHLPYFNIFLTEPAEAAHDWPDFGDVMTRQLQGVTFGRKMTGITSKIEEIWRRKTLAYINPETGLLRRPETSYCQSAEDPGDQALTLYALVTDYADNPGSELKSAVVKMCAGMEKIRDDTLGSDFNGFALKGFMAAVRYAGVEDALKTAAHIADNIMNKDSLYNCRGQ